MAGQLSSMPCLHAFPCEQAPRQSLHPHHPSLWDYAMIKEKKFTVYRLPFRLPPPLHSFHCVLFFFFKWFLAESCGYTSEDVSQAC